MSGMSAVLTPLQHTRRFNLRKPPAAFAVTTVRRMVLRRLHKCASRRRRVISFTYHSTLTVCRILRRGLRSGRVANAEFLPGSQFRPIKIIGYWAHSRLSRVIRWKSTGHTSGNEGNRTPVVALSSMQALLSLRLRALQSREIRRQRLINPQYKIGET